MSVKGLREPESINHKELKIVYTAFILKVNECINLLNPTFPSTNHIAHKKIWSVWTFMVLGESLGFATNIALDKKIEVQNILKSDLTQIS